MRSPVNLIAGDRRNRAAHAPALVAGLIAGSTLVGYAYGVRVFVWMAAYNQMALHNTALGMLAFSAAVLMARPRRGLMGAITGETAGGAMARRLLPVVVLIPFILDGLALLTGWPCWPSDRRSSTPSATIRRLIVHECDGPLSEHVPAIDGEIPGGLRRRSPDAASSGNPWHDSREAPSAWKLNSIDIYNFIMIYYC